MYYTLWYTSWYSVFSVSKSPSRSARHFSSVNALEWRSPSVRQVPNRKPGTRFSNTFKTSLESQSSNQRSSVCDPRFIYKPKVFRFSIHRMEYLESYPSSSGFGFFEFYERRLASNESRFYNIKVLEF